MDGKLFQIAGGKIYQIDETTGTRTEKASVGYDQPVDVMAYETPKGALADLATATAYSYSVSTSPTNIFSETPGGTIDGTNKTFYLDNVPLSFISVIVDDVSVYDFTISGTTLKLGPSVSAPTSTILVSYQTAGKKVGKIRYTVTSGVAKLEFLPYPSDDQTVLGVYYLPTNNGTYAYPAVKIVYATTTGGANSGTGRDEGGTKYVLQPGQFMQLNSEQYAGTVTFDTSFYVSRSKILIASSNQVLRNYDGETTVSTVSTAPANNSGILEFCRNFSFLASGNVLYISRPVTATNPEYAYDFTGAGSQQISYETEIVALKSTMNGLYVFTRNRVEFLGANALQSVAGAATFISTPLGEGSEPIANQLVVAVGDKILTVTKNLQVQTVNFVQGIESATVGELSARPVINIKEFLNTLDVKQPTGCSFYNENDKTAQFHLRTIGSPFNDVVLVYDLVNDTWNVDTNKNYSQVVKIGNKYFGFSDVNDSVYLDDVGFSDSGNPIEFRIRTQNLNQGTPFQKKYGGFYIMGGVGPLTEFNIVVNVDSDNVFEDSVSGSVFSVPNLGEIAGNSVGEDPVGGELYYTTKLFPFDRIADEGRIFTSGKRIQFEIFSYSQIQDFIIDSL